MDYYKCENCGKVFDEFEMNYRAAQVDKKCWCRACREAAQHRVQSDECQSSSDKQHEFYQGSTWRICAHCGTRR